MIYDGIYMEVQRYDENRKELFHSFLEKNQQATKALLHHMKENMKLDRLNEFEMNLYHVEMQLLQFIDEMMGKFSRMRKDVTFPHFAKFIDRMELKLQKFNDKRERLIRRDEAALTNYKIQIYESIMADNTPSLHIIINFVQIFLRTFKPTFYVEEE